MNQGYEMTGPAKAPSHSKEILVAFFVVVIFLPILASAEEIYKFERMWPTLQQPWYFKEPYGIAVDGDGNYYIADTGYHRIQKITSEGQLITRWGSFGHGPGQFSEPIDIAVDPQNRIYVTDKKNHRIQRFTLNGTFLDEWGQFGDGDGEFNEPWGIVVDQIGNVYVADSQNARTQRFTSEMEFVDSFSWQPEYRKPFYLDVDSEGNLYESGDFNGVMKVDTMATEMDLFLVEPSKKKPAKKKGKEEPAGKKRGKRKRK